MWKVHDLSRLTGVSARTLHHYDAIGLLTPSSREANGYRLYAECDLTRLQQIVALKFLGFSLKHITELLAKRGDLQEQLALQSAMLGKKIESLRAMQRAVNDIVAKAQAGQSLDLKHTLKLIEVYRMNAKTGQAWLNEVMEHHQASHKIMSERIVSGLQDEQVLAKIAESAKGLEAFVKKATPFIGTDPTTPEARELADEWFALVMEVFAEQVEIMTILSQRWMLDQVPVLPCSKEFAGWMIQARAYQHIKHTWIAKTLSKELLVQYLDMVTAVPVERMLARQKAQAVLLQEVKNHLDDDPTSDIGKDIAQRWDALNYDMYNDYPEVKKALQKAYWDGNMPNAPYTRKEAEWIRDASIAAGIS